ncbi:MAG: hypothetical protein R3A12_14525 [Ignavibacteria bacterium]
MSDKTVMAQDVFQFQYENSQKNLYSVPFLTDQKTFTVGGAQYAGYFNATAIRTLMTSFVAGTGWCTPSGTHYQDQSMTLNYNYDTVAQVMTINGSLDMEQLLFASSTVTGRYLCHLNLLTILIKYQTHRVTVSVSAAGAAAIRKWNLSETTYTISHSKGLCIKEFTAIRTGILSIVKMSRQCAVKILIFF